MCQISSDVPSDSYFYNIWAVEYNAHNINVRYSYIRS